MTTMNNKEFARVHVGIEQWFLTGGHVSPSRVSIKSQRMRDLMRSTTCEV